jgi:hypothetical protein
VLAAAPERNFETANTRNRTLRADAGSSHIISVVAVSPLYADNREPARICPHHRYGRHRAERNRRDRDTVKALRRRARRSLAHAFDLSAMHDATGPVTDAPAGRAGNNNAPTRSDIE